MDTHAILPGKRGVTFLADPQGEVAFPSTEHAFQCAKAQFRRDVDFCLLLTTAQVARCGQGRLHLSKWQREAYRELGGDVVSTCTDGKKRWVIAPNQRFPRRDDWHEIKIPVMWMALRAKFEQNPHLWGESRVDSLPAIFIEHTRNDSQWGDASDGSGTNYLGKLLSILLWELRTGARVGAESPSVRQWLAAPNVATCPGFYEQRQETEELSG